LKPTFLFIGPDKSGSTWLYEVLRQHAQCFVPPVKDIYFFDRYYERGLDWYFRFFEAAPPGTLAAGELSHDYLFSSAAAERIAQDLPGVKLITSLRDPAERTFSHYLYMIRSGRTRLDFADFSHADLSHADLTGAVLRRVCFDHADTTGAKLTADEKR